MTAKTTSVWITGEAGMLAREVGRVLEEDSNYEVLNSFQNPFFHFDSSYVKLQTSHAESPEFDVLMDPPVKPDVLVHTAALTGTDKCLGDMSQAFLTNTYATFKLGKFCLDNHVKMVYFSTTAIFDPRPFQVLVESSVQRPVTLYGATKQAGESLLRSILPPEQLLIIRPCFIYGSGNDHASNIARIMRNTLEKKITVLLIDPMKKKDYTHFLDFGTGIKTLLDKQAFGEYNISAGFPLAYLEIVKIIGNVMGEEADVVYFSDEDYLGDHIVNSSKLEQLGWQPKVALEEGASLQWQLIQRNYMSKMVQ